MSVSNRFKLFIAYLKANKLIKTQKELGYLLGFETESAFSQVVNGKVPFSETLYNKLRTLYNFLNIEWLRNDEGEMFKKSEKNVSDYKHLDGKFSETKRFPKEVIIITAKAGLNLQSNYYADELLQDLEKRVIYLDHDAKGRYFEIDCIGDSMNDGSIDSIANGDKLLLREIPKIYWKDKFHINKWDFTFFHYDKGFITKRIKEHNIETGDLLLESRNPDKEHYPDFWINLKECAIVTNVVEVRRQKGVFY
ncbi:hypothetical protein NAL32_07305 [Chryseobacterium sp. Ch-15]|uniref:Peptidase S24/S26A/S26B/S26C domain-containing protein n=1 Tax=Chryseobacterium muglaense TaxID=2893752 RepID=A0A9Q3UNW6_9FLAO|nr:hypothetical protein [Chryseobacterium muglaense]MBD3904438.1 hypothetical protein [Chryseobacterium muglaense]MCC9032743.1 hypothetical protein [Chryseobacterium muglaense]MCM2554200.1 hypothetical protein [Chryseobacterium muglaense]